MESDKISLGRPCVDTRRLITHSVPDIRYAVFLYVLLLLQQNVGEGNSPYRYSLDKGNVQRTKGLPFSREKNVRRTKGSGQSRTSAPSRENKQCTQIQSHHHYRGPPPFRQGRHCCITSTFVRDNVGQGLAPAVAF